MSQWSVVCLCAQWCGVCGGYRAIFDALALQHPHTRFVWVDVEDESELVGELDIETFPTLLIADASGPRFFAPLAPYADVLGRLLLSLQAQSERTEVVALETRDLWARIQHAYA